MPLRVQSLRLRQPNALQSFRQYLAPRPVPLCLRLQKRSITADEKPLPTADKPGPGPNQEQLPHVSEEAAATGKITGEGGPEIEQGTPIHEILQRDKSGQEKAPKVIQQELSTTTPTGSRKFSTSARRAQNHLSEYDEDNLPESDEPPGHVFGLPSLPIPKDAVLKYRYEPIVKQFTNLMMRDGKLSQAQRNTALILHRLKMAPPPRINPQRPLVPGTPPASHLPLDPVRYLTVVIESLAPLLKIKSLRGKAGGGRPLQIPVPLNQRQRRREAIMWMLDAASKRRFRGSGHGGFAQKMAEELISVAEGRSSLWDRRGGVHKIGVASRANFVRPRSRKI